MLSGLLNQYHPNVKAVISFLRLLKVKVNSQTVDDALQNHPDWPSLLCVSDALHQWHTPNAASKMETKDIEQLPVPFIANTNNVEYPLCVVKEIAEQDVIYLTGNSDKPEVKSKEEFNKYWTGIYLIAEPEPESGEKEYSLNKRKLLLQQAIPALLLMVVTGVSLYLFLRSSSGTVGIIFSTLIYALYAVGIIVTSLLLWYEIDKNNPLLQKVCTGIAKGNCNAILTGRQAKLFSWLSWSEVGFFYFTGGFLVLLFAKQPANLQFLGWLNLLALPYTVFSVYYQWRVAKQWCVLCLAVQALLLSGAFLFLTSSLPIDFSFMAPELIGGFATVYLLPVLLWYTAKPFVLQLQEAKNAKRNYLRLKFNTEIFETLLKKQKQVTVPADGLGIEIGNPNAVNTLIKVCNPYCGPCAKAHPEIEKLLEENTNLKVKIIFATPNDASKPSYKPVSHLLAIAEQNQPAVVKQSLDEWYLKQVKDYDGFAAKYPMNGELTKQAPKIEAMDKWCTAMNIAFTPTIFINGYQLPDVYNIGDLQYFLLETPLGN
jgi:thiol-disulfide isomerase/thioredoxin